MTDNEQQAPSSQTLRNRIKEEDETGCVVTAAPVSSRSPSTTLRISAQRRSSRKIRVFSGIINDIRSRAPYYVSDWTDAWNYRVIPAIVLIFFAK